MNEEQLSRQQVEELETATVIQMNRLHKFTLLKASAFILLALIGAFYTLYLASTIPDAVMSIMTGE